MGIRGRASRLLSDRVDWRPRPLWGLLAAVLLLLLLTAIGLGLRGGGQVALSSAVLVYLVAVVIVAIVGGVWPGVAAAVASDALLNWFFIPPYRTLAVDDPDNLTTLVVYVLVAVTVSVLVNVAAGQRAAAERSGSRAQQLAEVDRLRTTILRAVGHDLRTPLTAIKTAASGLSSRDVRFSDEDRAELVDTVVESADRLGDLIENLLALSRLQAGVLSVELQPIGVDEVVAQAALGFDPARLHAQVPDDLPLVYADPGLLERVIANLVDNALRAAAGGDVSVLAEVHGDTVRVAVVDHGPGIAPADLDRVFAPFQRLGDRSAEGHLGLGLAIARGFTDAMNGRLVPSRTPGGGLTMTIDLPIAR
ncbi:two-component system sensor histidine kinase KdpD [Actinoplanes octamycinicus]|uniref:histidine kinase n=1 Tax=Actinoplanes octamycinicus TaxID=135948 RepID=A0A7W7H1N7_9ACTN|nr:DUF4118 domain-containing protein [Actinoplanes octamycinicus]MBB4742169.1 two-component system sensor histidine kinase KdpD [Actinoplanes octamycinicus]GIE59984.1 hypothetical protein Aoc01nite_53860 [Actinoplanes octamycinicus]